MMSDSVQLEIRQPDKSPGVFEIEPGIYTVGSDDDCKIRIAHRDVEGRHAILTIRDDACWVEDLDTQSGTYVDGKRIHGHLDIKPWQEIGIGPFILVIRTDENKRSAASVPTLSEVGATTPKEVGLSDDLSAIARRATVEASAKAGGQPPSHKRYGGPDKSEKDQAPPPSGAEIEQNRLIKQQIHKELVERIDIKHLTASRVDKDELQEKALKTIKSIVSEVSPHLPPGIKADALIKEIYDEAVGLGPLEDLLQNPEITEIMVNGHNQIYVEKNGKLVMTDKTFMDNSSVLAIIERIVSPVGRRIDESQPYVDARLPDGSRINAIIHPLSLIGPCLTIRKFSKIPFTDEDLIKFGTMNSFIAEFIRMCVVLSKNIVVSGGTGSGKTTLLNVLSSYLPQGERIVTIEDAAELRLNQTHVIRLEARPPNIEGKGAVTIRDLVRNALRMRPDRIIVGECRGGEALDMLQAMNTGHDGSLTTVHANSPRDVISRLETMVLMSGMELPIRAIREQIASAVDLIVHEARLSDGTRKITKVTEVIGLEGDQITMQDIFEFKQTGIDDGGNVVGHFQPTGSVPTFIEELSSHGLTIDQSMFDPKQWKKE